MTSVPVSRSEPATARCGEPAVMRHELQIEFRDQEAGVAVAGRGAGDALQPVPESAVRNRNCVEQHRRIDPLAQGHHEDGITLYFVDPEGPGGQGPDQGVGQIRQDVVGMLELGADEIGRVSTDVGQQ